MKKKVLIIGGGASGLLAGILLAKQGCQVTILEKNKTFGKKLSATGNGRCNFTNEQMNSSCFYTKAPDDISRMLDVFGPEQVKALFFELGILSRSKDGYVYPYSNQAKSVVERLFRNCERLGVKMFTETEVLRIRKKHSFIVETTNQQHYADAVILACGGSAYSSLGGSELGYRLAKQCGHKVTSLSPGLTGYVSKGKWIAAMSGVRIQGTLNILANGEKVASDTGEIQCSKKGISGIPAFQLCHIVANCLAKGQSVKAQIDFLPGMSERELRAYFQKFKEPVENLLSGMIPSKCIQEVLKRGSSEQEIAHTLKAFEVDIVQTDTLESAQVTCGGVPLSEVNLFTMESKKMEGLYLVGELLDVDGICGGYNLHWAWMTAYFASQGIGKDL